MVALGFKKISGNRMKLAKQYLNRHPELPARAAGFQNINYYFKIPVQARNDEDLID